MSEPENFLARWSRRKAEAERRPETLEPDPVTAVEPEAAAPPAPTETKRQTNAERPIDLSKLPSIESIGPGSDVSAFLQKGVPGDLARAALRRVWTTDPAIRDFIGIAENQYDFATGSDIPGFGPLTPADNVARMAAQIAQEGMPRVSAAGAENTTAASDEPLKIERGHETVTSEPAKLENIASLDQAEPVGAAADESSADGASQQNEQDAPSAERSHGRALPR